VGKMLGSVSFMMIIL